MSLSTRLLVGGLLALAALYVFWFNANPWPAMAVFAGPPLLLAALCWNGANKPAFWAGLLALGWFSHGVMVAWSRPEERELAQIEIVLSLVVVLAASLPGLRARFTHRR
jgi:uncharacterized membrane protein